MKQPRGSAGGDFLFFIFFLVVLGIVWVLTGGPSRDISRAGPFLNLPFPLGSGGAYSVTIPSVSSRGSGGGGGGGADPDRNGTDGQSFFEIVSGQRGGTVKGDSPYASSITFSRGNVSTTDPDNEYLIIRTSRSMTGEIAISNWRVEPLAPNDSLFTKAGSTLGAASNLPLSGVQNSEEAVRVGAGATVYVITGDAPLEYSFRENICTGYFSETESFTPRLREVCPDVEDDFLKLANKRGLTLTDECTDYVETISRCKLARNFPSDVDFQCRNLITDNLNYNGCVNTHKSDAGFFRNVWYLYLERAEELWDSDDERIGLLDENGKIISIISY